MSTRNDIIDILYNNMDKYISGEFLSKELSISRAAIWKHISYLRDQGYVIEASSKVGYRLASSPDKIIRDRIIPIGEIGSDILIFDTLNSTNTYAKSLAVQNAPSGTLIIAEEQTTGRGRMSREWHSATGRGIYMTLLLRPLLSPLEATRLTMLTALAVYQALKKHSNIEPQLKWPNDILMNNKKLCGILTEMSGQAEGVDWVIIGIGINVNHSMNQFPDQLKEIATSLKNECGHSFDRIAIINDILVEFNNRYDEYVNRGVISNLLQEYRAICYTIGRSVSVQLHNGIVQGIAKDIDDEGYLLIETESGIVRVIAGDVSIANTDKI